VASLQGLDRDGRVIYIGTLSKVLFPALRVGYLVLPPDLALRFTAVRGVMDVFPSTLYQAVLADFLGEGHFGRHLRRMRQLYRQRRDLLVDGLRRELGEDLEVLDGQAGLHLVATLREAGKSDLAIAERAAREKLWAQPLSLAYLGLARRQGFILGYGGSSADAIEGAVRRLRDVLQAC
jgi:GntR family transcriptional regulator/MocR family aminotransferase